MRVCFVGRGAPKSVLLENGLGELDLIVFPFQGGEEVSYERELRGETERFEGLARLSKHKNCAVVCGMTTDALGLKRRSVLVAEGGKILGVSDMVNVLDGTVNVGACVRVFETKSGRMGVVVEEDLYFFEVFKSLSLCGCDFIVCPFGGGVGETERVMLRAQAFCFGVPILFCARGYSMVVGGEGEVSFASPLSPVVFSFERPAEYHLIETRSSGFSRRIREDE